MARGNLTVQTLYEKLHYDPETGIFTWKIKNNRTEIGQIAGSMSGGYLLCGIDQSTHSMHRLAWLYVHGDWPKYQIDHINGNRTDNRIANLRDVSHSMNQQNRRTAQCDAQGLQGTALLANGKGWRAALKLNGKVVVLGIFKTTELAHDAYLAGKRRLHPGNTL